MPPFVFFFAELGCGATFGEVLRVGAAGWGAERDHGPVPARAGRADVPKRCTGTCTWGCLQGEGWKRCTAGAQHPAGCMGM